MIKKLLFFFFILNSYTVFSQEDSKGKVLDTYRSISNQQLSHQQINELIIQYEDSLSLFIEGSNLPNKAIYNLSLAKLYYKQGGYNKALEYGKKALGEFKELKDTTALVYAYTTIGVIYGELDDYKIAEEYFREIDTLARLANREVLMYHNYINLGIMNLDNDVPKALDYFDKAEIYFKRKKGNNVTLVGLLNNKAVAYKRIGEYEKAIGILKNILNGIDQSHSYYVSICSNIATNYLLLNQADSALTYIKMGLNNPAKSLYINNYVNSYRVLTEAYIQKHNPDSSIKYFRLYQLYTDSLFLKKKVENISKLRVIHETDQLLDDVKKQHQKITEYNAKFRNLSIGISLLIITIIIFFIYYKKLQSSYKRIVKESVHAVLIEEENAKLIKKIEFLKKPDEVESNRLPSSFTLEKGDDIFEEIITLFKMEKLFTDPDFNLSKLADRLNSNRTYISNIINSKTGDSFVKFINTYRVKEAKKLLIDSHNKILTLDAIGKLAGFNSVSTFNRVFKIETGVTPSFYIKNTSDI
ncbi:MAG: AraC family transcriptional regulator [Bacteroidales bacterium]|nr:AraC family transcriptional regulator [Bacteroidales bacterium]